MNGSTYLYRLNIGPPVLNLLQWLWPTFVALFGNDHIMGGEDHYQNHLFLNKILRPINPFPPSLSPTE